MKECKARNCNNLVQGRKHYCSDRCQWIEGQLRKEDNKGLPPFRKRNNRYFSQYISSRSMRGQGKRSGGMIMGSMSVGRENTYSVVETTYENLAKHFSRTNNMARTCGDEDGFYISKESFESGEWKQRINSNK